MQRSGLSLKWLEVFHAVAAQGSLKAAGQTMGLSASTVSYHLRALEEALGVTLIDHSQRPMALTVEGAAYLPRVAAALEHLRLGEREMHASAPLKLRALRMALIEDFDSDIAPDLTRALATALPQCAFTHLTRPSHEILSMLHAGQLDIGVATRPLHAVEGLDAYPLLRDPFVLVVPKGADPALCLEGRAPQHFLRYSDDQIIGAQISSQLRRMRVTLTGPFQFESNQSLMGLVAEGQGWAITTATNVLRALRFHGAIDVHPFPGAAFSRHVTLFTAQGFAAPVTEMVRQTLRQLIQSRSVTPALDMMPWLEGQFTLESAAATES